MGKKFPLIEVKNNKFINAKGDTILFRGLSIAIQIKLKVKYMGIKTYLLKLKI